MHRHLPWFRAFLFLIGGLLGAVPPLTTIDDTLYRADGSHFSGTLLIEWKSFQASDSSTIATQSVRLPVVDGRLHVSLVPTTNASAGSYYSVRYLSASGLDSVEKWYVRPSSTSLRLADVRSAGGGTSSDTGANSPATIQISDVISLSAELSSRPQKGAGYVISRSAVINAAGQLEAAVGNLTDCLHVDGSAAPCSGQAVVLPAFIDGETPAGLVNGTNAVFTLTAAPNPPASLLLYRNGILQKSGADFALAGNVVTFGSGSLPQAGDILVVSYRVTGTSADSSGTSGDVASLPPGSVSDINVADTAAIRESKLALRFPTHSSANDPTTGQKSALTGTTGTPSASNKYVTDQDARLSDARIARSHALLGSGHSDTLAGTAARGDLLVAQGASPAFWSRLPLGPANRCLMSNGADAVWNTCLFTGFPAGAVPFVGSDGNLSQDRTHLAWDASNRRFSIGTSESSSTLLLFDSQPATGLTQLTVRAGQAQGSVALQKWQDGTGRDVALMDAFGNAQAASMQTGGGDRASYRDRGRTTDPVSVQDGDQWYSSSSQSLKSVTAGQVHTGPQVLCSSTGAATSSASLTGLGSCSVPAGLLQPGDRIEVRFDYLRTGSASSAEMIVRWSGTTLMTKTISSGESRYTGRAELGFSADTVFWSTLTWGGSAPTGLVTQAGSLPRSGNSGIVEFSGRLTGTPEDQIQLGQFSVLRYPAQANP